MVTARKNLADYPPEYRQLIDAALGGKKVALVCGSMDIAKKNRQQLYAFRTALLLREESLGYKKDLQNLRFTVTGRSLTIDLES